MTRGIRVLMERHRLNLCLECGKCSAVCPMVEIYGEYVANRCPRSIVETLLFETEAWVDEALWYCWACQECTFFCPSGVDFQHFMMDFRNLVVSHGYRDQALFCTVCGSYLVPKKQADVMTANLQGEGEALSECPICMKNRFVNAFVQASTK